MQLHVVRAKVLQSSLEKETATHSSLPAWRILWTEEPDRLQSQTQLSRSSGGLQPSGLLCPWDSQARILERVTMPSSRGSSPPRD